MESNGSTENHRKVRRMDAAATSVLWASAAFTIGILLCIVGYIVFRGLVSDNRRSYEVIGRGAPSFPLPDGGEGVVIVNRSLRLADLTLEDVRSLLGGETASWGLLSGQDLDVVPVALRDGQGDGTLSFAAATLRKDGAEEVVRAVEAAPGAVGFLRADILPPEAARRVKVIPVRSIAIAVDPAVMELTDGRRLASVDEAVLKDLFTGRIANWKSVGGPDLPVRVFRLEPATVESRGFRGLALDGADWAATAAVQPDARTLLRAVASTPGAVGFVPYAEAAGNAAVKLLPVERREIRPNLTLSFFLEEPKRAGKVGGVSTIIGNTLLMILLTLLMATPIGVGAAVYLTEYARQGPLVRILRFGTETLAGIPSIIFGLFGYIVFVGAFHWGIGLLSGTLTVTMMILPTIVRTAEEAIKAVPASHREGSLALGATRWQTVTRVVLRAASPGILTGVILGIGRAIGETAALIFTMGTDYRSIQGLLSSARVLSVHLYILVKEGISFDKAFATAMILIVVILAVNFTATRLIGRMHFMQTTGGGRHDG